MLVNSTRRAGIQTAKHSLFSDHTMESLNYKQVENNVVSNKKHLEHKNNALRKAEANIEKLKQEINDVSRAQERAILDLALLTDGAQSTRINIVHLTWFISFP